MIWRLPACVVMCFSLLHYTRLKPSRSLRWETIQTCNTGILGNTGIDNLLQVGRLWLRWWSGRLFFFFFSCTGSHLIPDLLHVWMILWTRHRTPRCSQRKESKLSRQPQLLVCGSWMSTIGNVKHKVNLPNLWFTPESFKCLVSLNCVGCSRFATSQ